MKNRSDGGNLQHCEESSYKRHGKDVEPTWELA